MIAYHASHRGKRGSDWQAEGPIKLEINSLLIIIRRYMRLADRPTGRHTLAFFRTCLRIAGTTAKRDTLRAVNKYIDWFRRTRQCNKSKSELIWQTILFSHVYAFPPAQLRSHRIATDGHQK